MKNILLAIWLLFTIAVFIFGIMYTFEMDNFLFESLVGFYGFTIIVLTVTKARK